MRKGPLGGEGGGQFFSSLGGPVTHTLLMQRRGTCCAETSGGA